MEHKHIDQTNFHIPHSLKNVNTIYVSQCNLSIPSSSLWNFRICHLSRNRVTYMSHLYPIITHNKISFCDIFYFSKRKQLPFKTNNSHVKSKYEFLHFDILGPLSIQSLHNHNISSSSLMIIVGSLRLSS